MAHPFGGAAVHRTAAFVRLTLAAHGPTKPVPDRAAATWLY